MNSPAEPFRRILRILGTGILVSATVVNPWVGVIYRPLISHYRDVMFDPDMVMIGFCLNDITDPFVLDPGWGGMGNFFGEVSLHPNFLIRYLSSETGLGRLVFEVRKEGLLQEETRRREAHGVRAMVSSPEAPRWQDGWDQVLGDLEQMYRIAGSRPGDAGLRESGSEGIRHGDQAV